MKAVILSLLLLFVFADQVQKKLESLQRCQSLEEVEVTSFYVILPFYCSVISHTKIIIVCEQLIGGLLPCSPPFFFFFVVLFICCHNYLSFLSLSLSPLLP